MNARLAAGALAMTIMLAPDARAGWSRDPFVFGVEESDGNGAPPRLEMILIKEGERVAVFNSERMRAGGVVEGYVIVEITLDTVVARKGSLEKVYRLE